MNILKIRNELRNGRTIFDLPLRVTFYARVSTDKDEQLNSLENQVQYYTQFIQEKRNWAYVQGYVDEGISGSCAAASVTGAITKLQKFFIKNGWMPKEA